MILIFPNIDTLHLAMMSGRLPKELLSTPTRFSRDSSGRHFVETDAKLPRQVLSELSKLGVAGSKRHVSEPIDVSCWFEIIPLLPITDSSSLTNQTPILFDIPSAELFTSLVTEMLRLGNDRQSYLSAPSESSQTHRTLLRVIGPPYYTLLRAIDRATPGLIAYYEQSPRIWIAFGFKHPGGHLLQQPEGRLALLRHGEPWELLPEEPFHDIYEVLRFELPSPPQLVEPIPQIEPFEVPLRLIPSTSIERADLWVFHGDAEAVLDIFVRDTDERIVRRLKFAIGKSEDGSEVTVLRTLPSKQPPPELTFPDAMGFRPFRKLPNLYLPVKNQLYPTLRRDAVRQLLADDPDRVVWLYPTPEGSFVPESLTEDAFRPLSDWVEYTIDKHRSPLAEWVNSSQFDFDAFVCAEHQSQEAKGRKRAARPADSASQDDSLPDRQTPENTAQEKQSKSDPSALESKPACSPEQRPRSEWEKRRTELEVQFLGLDGEFDHPKRQVLWGELARTNTALNDTSDAAICYSHAIWHAGPERLQLLRDWAVSEVPEPLDHWLDTTCEQRLKAMDNSPSQVREVAAVFLALSEDARHRKLIVNRLTRFRTFFEHQEQLLPVRIAWLVSTRIAVLSGADPLGLARVRDRMLQRLLESGLNAERDLPVFLRTEGIKDSEQVRRVRRSVIELQALAHTWTATGVGSNPGVSDGGATVAYVDLLFAYGLAKFGEANQARDLIQSATTVLTSMSSVEAQITAGFLLRAFQFRIEQVLRGQSATGPFSSEILAELDDIQTKGELTKVDNNNPHKSPNYTIARMREQSRILEPHENFEPYAILKTLAHDLEKTLTRLQRERNPDVIARTLRDLYAKGATGRTASDCRFLVLLEGLPIAGRVSGEFVIELLGHVASTITIPSSGEKRSLEQTKKQGQLLERSLLFAAHYDRRDLVQQFSDIFTTLVRMLPLDHRLELVNAATRSALRSLRTMGLRDEMDRLLQHLRQELLRGESLAQVSARYASKPAEWSKVLQSLLHLAGGWHALGMGQHAQPIMEQARTQLLSKAPPRITPLEFTKLTQAYLAALALGPVEEGLDRIEELLRQIAPTRYCATFTTSPYYSRLHLNVIEEVVHSLTSDGFALGPAGQRWLEEDEYLIRRRIHSDVRNLLDSSGL